MSTLKSTYWDGKGKYEVLKDKCFAQMSKEGVSGWDEFSKPENEEWAFLNGMCGVYYGYFNDGDNLEGAIDNSRFHGYNSLEKVIELAKDVGAPPKIKKYLNYDFQFRNEKLLEEVLDECILFIAKAKGISETPEGPEGPEEAPKRSLEITTEEDFESSSKNKRSKEVETKK